MQQLHPLTLRRNFSWTFAGNFVYAASQWGMLVILAKLSSPEMVGQFTLGLAVTAPVVMFTNLQLRAIQATDARKQYLFSDYLGLRLIMTGLALAIITGITFATGYRWEKMLVILVIGLAKAFESISDVFYGLLQQYEQMDRVAISMMIKGPLSLIMLGSGVYLTGSVLWGVVGLAVAWALVLVSYDARSSLLVLKAISSARGTASKHNDWKTVLKPRWQIKTLIKLAWLALPLGLVMMLISLNTNIPRYFIERYLGERELGIFAAISYLQVAGTMIVSALSQSASPRLAKYYTKGNKVAFRMLLLKVVGIGALLGTMGGLVALVCGQKILTLLYRPEYASYANIFTWVIFVAGIGYIASFLGYGMTAAGYFRVQIPLFTLVTATTALASLWLIPAYSLLGAVIALGIATLVQVCGSLAIIMRALDDPSKSAYGGTK